jgi:dTDP-4-dehydrorhamnose 3,5-epimerase
MEFIETLLPGCFIIKPKVFEDPRGYFFECYNEALFRKNGISTNFVQDNQSMSQKDVVRGLHFQAPPYAQGKLVRVLAGSVLDVVVDIRKELPTYGKYFALELSAENKIMLWVPEGFAHGFLTLEDNTVFHYKCTNFYNKVSEGGISWNDPNLAINWGTGNPILSEKDKTLSAFRDFVSPF